MTASPKIRVLLVDDSVVVRRFLTELIDAEPDLEVVGSAGNGRLGLQQLAQLRPDVVVLDIEMPELDGIGTLQEIRAVDRRLPVIMFSTLTERGAAATLEALSAGASDYATKPASSSGIASAADQLRSELLPKIRMLGARTASAARPASGGGSPGPAHAPAPLLPSGRVRPAPGTGPEGLRARSTSVREAFSGRPASRAAAPAAAPRRPAVPLGGEVRLRAVPAGPAPRVDVVAIGVSTGGPNALAELVPALPATLGVPVLVVQHMPPTFTALLAQRLDRASALRVVEAAPGMPVRPNEVYIAPGDHHMVVRRAGAQVVVDLNQDPPEHSCRPAVDVLFRSVGEVFGGHVLAVVLTGMGQDGYRGAEALVARGARVLAQDEATSVVWGMPGFVARGGLAEAVLPLGQLAAEIVRRVGRSGPAAAPAVASGGVGR